MLPAIPPGIWIATSFPFSKGDRYPYAVELAKGADYYHEEGGKRLVHVAGHRCLPESIQRAIALLEYAGHIRGCMTSNGSSIWDASRTLRVLRCYLGALSLQKPSVYCQAPNVGITSVLLGVQPELLPCKHLAGYFIRNWHCQGSTAEQWWDAGIESGVEWCPCFKAALKSEGLTPLQDEPSLLHCNSQLLSRT